MKALRMAIGAPGGLSARRDPVEGLHCGEQQAATEGSMLELLCCWTDLSPSPEQGQRLAAPPLGCSIPALPRLPLPLSQARRETDTMETSRHPTKKTLKIER